MDFKRIASLFVDREPTDETSEENHKLLASLHHNKSFQAYVKITQMSYILNVLELVGQRKLDEAYGEFKALEAWTDSLVLAEESSKYLEEKAKGMEGGAQTVTATVPDNSTIKF